MSKPIPAATLTTALSSKPTWQDRERARFDKGKYKPVPWSKEAWFNGIGADDPRAMHYVHVSEKDPYMLAYTPKAADGEADRRVPIKPGRYLQKFFSGELTPDQIKHWAAQVRGTGIKLQFTENPALALKVYQSPGLTACMSHGPTHYSAYKYNGGIWPIAAYLGGDLTLAYACNPEGAIIARAWVWPEKRLYTRAYGDHEAMCKALTAEGYTYGLFDGARLAIIPLTGAYAGDKPRVYMTAPYVDHVKWAKYDAAEKTLRLQSKATGATHSVQHGDGICYPIEKAPSRPAAMSGESVHSEWTRLVALESGKPAEKPEPKAQAGDRVEIVPAPNGHRFVAQPAGIFGVVMQQAQNQAAQAGQQVVQNLAQQAFQEAAQVIMQRIVR